MAILVGNEVPSPEIKVTQVYKATHEGADRLPLRNRSFISFSYGGRSIEDFNLLAVFSNNRLQRAAYGQFEDLTTQYEVVDGQFYWGTHFLNNTLEFSLSTDGMTELELSDFKNWFRPGKMRELVLAESPNRAILARVATPPVYSVIPFEQQTTQKINGVEYTTSTTYYRGDISLAFTMDDPYWYSRNSIIHTYFKPQDDKFASTFEDDEGAVTSKSETLADPDFIKAILEDGVAHSSMIDKASGIIFGDETEGTTIDADTVKYLYYCGSAPARPTIHFTFKPYLDHNYIGFPYNYKSQVALNNLAAKSYNTINVGENSIRFTIPAAFIGFNQAIDTAEKFKEGESLEEFRSALRDNITEYYSRSWAMFCVEIMKNKKWGTNDTGALTTGFFGYFAACMKYFIFGALETEETFRSNVTINCQTGEVFTQFRFRQADDSLGFPDQIEDLALHPYFIIEESTEDMIRSNYLQIEGKCHPNSEGKITHDDCLLVTTDCDAAYGGLEDFRINYKNLYL